MIKTFAKISTTIFAFILSVQLGVATKPLGFDEDAVKSPLSSIRWGLSSLVEKTNETFAAIQAILRNGCFIHQIKRVEQEIPWDKKWDAIRAHVLTLNKEYYWNDLWAAYLLDQKLKKDTDLETQLAKFLNHFKHFDDIIDYFNDYFKGKPIKESDRKQLREVLDWRILQDVKLLGMDEVVSRILQKNVGEQDFVKQLPLFSQSIVKNKKDLQERDFFMHAKKVSDLLWNSSQLSRTEDQLPILMKKVLKFYTKWDGGELSMSSKETLRGLGIPYKAERKESFNISRATAAGGLIFLTISHHMRAPAAQGPSWFNNTCTDSLEGCESVFVPSTYGGGFTTELQAVTTDARYQAALGNMTLPGNNANVSAAVRTNMAYLQLSSSPYCYSVLTTFATGAIPGGNITRSVFTYSATGTGPYTAEVYIPTGPTQYNATSIGYLNYNQINSISTTIGTGPTINSYYLGQYPNSETWFLTVFTQSQDSAVTTAVLRPNGGTPQILWTGRIVTPNTTNLSDNPANLTTTPVNTNKSSQASSQDNSTYDQFVASVWSGPVHVSNCQGTQSLQQFVTADNLPNTPLYQGLTTCFQQPGLVPLACANYMVYNLGYTRLTFFFSEGPNVFKRVIDGPNVIDCTYRAANASSVIQECQVYPWNPSVGVPTLTNTTLPQSFNTIKGSLVDGQVQKFAELYYSQVPSAATILNVNWTASGTSVSYYAFLDHITCGFKKRNIDEPKVEVEERHYEVDLARLKEKEAQKGWYDFLKESVFGSPPSFDEIDPYKMSPEQWYEFYRKATSLREGKSIRGITLFKDNVELKLRFIEEGASTFGLKYTWKNSTLHEYFKNKIQLHEN